jgi:hypothetical protein
MTNRVMQRLANAVRFKRLAVLKRVNGAHVKLGLLAAALFIVAYAV